MIFMIVKQLDKIIKTENEVSSDNWISRRLLLKKDNMGFSLHDTIIKSGTETFIWYKNHLEAVYCIEGCGEIELLESGKKYSIKKGTMYALDGNEKHYLRADEEMRLICVFNPPVTGHEVHDADGAYPLVE